MTYILGIDLGTTFSAAAVVRDDRAEIVTLGTQAHAIPSVVVVDHDSQILVGEPAARRSWREPERTAREFKRRFGDPTPIILGGTPYGAEALTGFLLRTIVERVVETEGERPDRIVVTHPATYGPYKIDLLVEAARQADIGPVTFLPEPVAAAVQYARRERIGPNEVVAVYDFGGGTFDAAVVQATDDGFTILGEPDGMERIGGVDFDEAILAHVDEALAGALTQLDDDDEDVLPAVARLREECQRAKEALSADAEAVITVALPGLTTEVVITRADFEPMIAPRVGETIAALQRTLRTSGVPVDDVARVLLVGGSSRIPLVARMVETATGRPTALDAHPKLAIATGAALAGANRLQVEAAERAAAEQAALDRDPTAVPAPSATSCRHACIAA